LFGANRLLEPAPADQPLTEMPAEAWRACENASGSTRLLDPQGLLSETQGEDLTRLLAFHSEQAGVSAWILLVDSRQKLPSDADLSKLASGELARSTTCLAVYSFGAPARTRLFLTQSVSQAAAPGYLESLLNGCVREASLSPDPVEQLQRFATQLSIRLFWLERAYPVLKPKVVETPHAMETPESLSEVISIESSVAPPSKFLVFWRSAKYYISAAGGLLVLFVLILIAFARWRKRRNRMKVWRLPDFDHHHETRFGGPHCGGCGASIHFG